MAFLMLKAGGLFLPIRYTPPVPPEEPPPDPGDEPTVPEQPVPDGFLDESEAGHHDNIPDFGATPTITSVQSGDWDDVDTWDQDHIPWTNDVVRIADTHTVTYNVDSTKHIACVGIGSGGTLAYDHTIDTKLRCCVLLIYAGGHLQIGTAANPIDAAKVSICEFADLAIDTDTDPEQFGNGIIACGKVTVNGAPLAETFARLAVVPAAGHTTLTLAAAVPSGWRVGDVVVLPDSRHLPVNDAFVWYVPRWERRTITAIVDDVITLDSALAYAHPGGKNKDGTVEYFPHVGNLTRNVKFRSVNRDGTKGHTIWLHRTEPDINYAEFYNLGRTTGGNLNSTTFDGSGNVTHIGTNQIGRYAIHAHHTIGHATVPLASGRSWQFRGCSIWGDWTMGVSNQGAIPKWPMTFHDAHYGEMSDCVLHNYSGSLFAAEDGSETENILNHNFGVFCIGQNNPRNNDGRDGSGVWLTGFNHHVTNNVMANCICTSIAIVAGSGFNLWAQASWATSNAVRIPSAQGNDKHEAGQFSTVFRGAQPILEFDGNEAYGTMATGVVLWEAKGATNALDNTIIWHARESYMYFYPANNIVIDGVIIRGDYSAQASNSSATGITHGDYRVTGLTVRNFNIQNVWTGIADPGDSPGTVTFEDGYICPRVTGISVSIQFTPGTQSVPGARQTFINNVEFEEHPSATPGSLVKLRASYPGDTKTGCHYTTLDEIFVTDHDGVVDDNFQLFWDEQDEDYVVPQHNPPLWFSGVPEAGLTNAEAWAEYGKAIGGAVMPEGVEARAGVVGKILPEA